MWDVTGWAVVTWLKTTAFLAALVASAWLWLGAGSGWFTIVCLVAVLGELYLARQLVREWNNEAGLRWWWNR